MTTTSLYQLEVKLGLARFPFQKAAGWRITMHVDSMEKGMGGKHSRGKVKRANEALRQLRTLGVIKWTHDLFGPFDGVAEHADKRTTLDELEGEAGRQR